MTTIAVVTATIGRPTLRETIESVRNQTVACQHYVFVHGKEYSAKANFIVDDYPDLRVIHLPVNVDRGISGVRGGYGAAPVYAAAGYLVPEDVIFYLDDDNTYDREHVASVSKLITDYGLGFAYALRRIISHGGSTICDDNCESLGYFVNASFHHIVDSSCLAVRADLARRASFGWYRRVASDRHFLAALMDSDTKGGCTGRHTVNYRLSDDSSAKAVSAEKFHQWNKIMLDRFPDGLPWLKPTLQDFRDA